MANLRRMLEHFVLRTVSREPACFYQENGVVALVFLISLEPF